MSSAAACRAGHISALGPRASCAGKLASLMVGVAASRMQVRRGITAANSLRVSRFSLGPHSEAKNACSNPSGE